MYYHLASNTINKRVYNIVTKNYNSQHLPWPSLPPGWLAGCGSPGLPAFTYAQPTQRPGGDAGAEEGLFPGAEQLQLAAAAPASQHKVLRSAETTEPSQRPPLGRY
jgi:hypothetical protein